MKTQRIWMPRIQKSSAILFVDNVSVACMVANGCTRMPDLQPIVNALLVHLKHLKCKWWIEYVPSKANPADEPSRSGSSCFAKCEQAEPPLWATPFMDLRSAIKVAHPKSNETPQINTRSKKRHLLAAPKPKRRAWLEWAKTRKALVS